MRSVVFSMLVAAAGCRGARQAGPVWPAPSTTADDGGESLEPKPTAVAASVEHSADANSDDAKPEADAPKAAASDDKPAPSASQPTAPSTDPVMIDDEIIIEVDD